MLYAILCYDEERVTEGLTRDEDGALMDRLRAVQEPFARRGKLGPVARLQPTAAAATLRKGGEGLVVDGPFAETKEQLLGFYVVDCATRKRGAGVRARACRRCAAGTGAYEVRPVRVFRPGALGHERARRSPPRLSAARPQAVGALLRYFRDLDTAEEAFQEASLRALQQLAGQGPAARSGGLADLRRPQRRARRGAPAGQAAAAAGRGADVRPRRRRERRSPRTRQRDYPRRRVAAAVHLLPSGAAAQPADRAGAAHRLRAFRSRQIARAFLVGESAMEQRITRAKRRVAEAACRSRRPTRRAGRAARRRRRDGLSAVQRGLFGERRRARMSACRSARRRSGWRACCWGCFRPRARSWG